jgi:hypothetical protein
MNFFLYTISRWQWKTIEIINNTFAGKRKIIFVQYVSFEHVIEERKIDYNQALMECQRNRNTDKEFIGT